MTRHPYLSWLLATGLVLSRHAALADSSSAVQETTPGEAAAGALHTVGYYPGDTPRVGETVTQLADGTVFVHGAESASTFKDGTVVLDPGARRQRAIYVEPEAINWDPKRRGWVNRGRPPECPLNLQLHTATRLGGNRILFAGGLCDVPPYDRNTATLPPTAYNHLSIWNQTTEAWESAPSLAQGRIHHTATPIKDGSVLIVGGHDDRPAMGHALPVFASVERFVDAEGGRSTVTQAPGLHTARAKHTAVRLKDGRVLVLGGVDSDNRALASVEIFDPDTMAWRTAASLHAARYQAVAELLDDGRVLVIGGRNAAGRTMSSVEVYAPATDTWSEMPQMLVALKTLSSVKLTSGDVLVVGCTDDEYGNTVSMALLWKAADAQWRPAGALKPEGLRDIRDLEHYELLARDDGGALVFGNRVVMQWVPAAVKATTYHPVFNRTRRAAATLADGSILLAGGRISRHPTTLAELYDPNTNTFTLTGPMRQARFTGMPFQHALSSLVLNDGRVIIAGGWVASADDTGQNVPNSPDVWSPATGQWDTVAGLRFDIYDRVYFNQRDDGRVVFFQSREQDEAGINEFSAWIWDPLTARIEQQSVNVKARAGASVTVLRDGRVLIVGGHFLQQVPEYRCPPPVRHPASSDEDEEGDGCQDEAAHWIAEGTQLAEVWDSRSGHVSTLTYPRSLPVDKIQSLLLRNGNVLLTHVDPPGPAFPRSGSEAMVVWDARAGLFKELPRLNTLSGWPITEQHDGSLIAWGDDAVTPNTVSRLMPGASAWEAMPRFPQQLAVIKEADGGRLLALSSMQPFVAEWNELGGTWTLKPDGYMSMGSPAIVDLGKGAFAMIGTVPRAGFAVQTWDPQTGRWSFDPVTKPGLGGVEAAARLRSGHILVLSRGEKSSMVCHMWRPMEHAWSDCGQWPPANGDDHYSGFTLDLLEDGRAAFIAGPNIARVFNEANGQWQTMKAEWNMKGLHPGEAVRPTQPLLRLYDADAGAWIDANEAGGHYYSHAGGPLGPTPAMLWDRNKQRWAYIVRLDMGKEGFWLPDGCALSGLRFTLYTPSTGAMTRLEDVITGFSTRVMNVLSDGTVIAAGDAIGANETGGDVFRRRASCAGFAAANDGLVSMPSVYIRATRPSSAPLQAESVTPKAEPLLQRVRGWIEEHVWLLLAIVGPLVLYGVLRFVIRWFNNRYQDSAASRPIGKSTATRVEMFIVRVVGYGVAALIAIPLLLNVLALREQASESLSVKPESSQPPCDFIGRWTTSRKRGATFTLQDDGRYVFESPIANPAKGTWDVKDNAFVWRSPLLQGEADVNKILAQTATSVVIQEQDGSRTKLELIERIPSTRCKS